MPHQSLSTANQNIVRHVSMPAFLANAKPVFETDIAPTDNVRQSYMTNALIKWLIVDIFYTPPACVLQPMISLLSTGHIIRMEQSLEVGVEWNGTR